MLFSMPATLLMGDENQQKYNAPRSQNDNVMWKHERFVFFIQLSAII